MKLQDLYALPDRVVRRLRRDFQHAREQVRILTSPTFPTRDGAGAQLASRFDFLTPAFLRGVAASVPGFERTIRVQADLAVSHQFDLLGSGLVNVKHGMECRGLAQHRYSMSRAVRPDAAGAWLEGRINRTNVAQARRVWLLVEGNYTPIDWQLDFKSGFRWSERAWWRRVRIGHVPGADVKVPWELARLQHLPTLALAARCAAAGFDGFQPADVYGKELQNQILDFIATNPPGFGVNWASPMEVAIRAANMLVARDILVSSSGRLSRDFERVFLDSIAAHARHVAKHLEWHPKYRGNHYLANIAGLLFASVYLPSNPEVDACLCFAVEELLSEIRYQFHEDGSNFEASVCYHRLSAEMTIWAIALLSALPADKHDALQMRHRWRGGGSPKRHAGPLVLYDDVGSGQRTPVPAWCFERLRRMAAFTLAMTRADGCVVQFGDNDSGRFISLAGAEQSRADNKPSHPAWSLDHRGLAAAALALTGDESGSGDAPADGGAMILRGFARNVQKKLSPNARLGGPDAGVPVGGDRKWQAIQEQLAQAPVHSRWESRFEAEGRGLLRGLRSMSFPGMGCYVLRSDRIFLAIRCGELGIAGLGAHAHCDQLAIELMIDDRDVVRDPGTYVYTPLPSQRNLYRSLDAHHVPRVARQETADLTRGLFDLRDATEGECLYFGLKGFVGRHKGFGAWVYRVVQLSEDAVVVRDFAEGGLSMMDPTPRPLAFSQGYGRLMAPGLGGKSA